CGAVHERSTMSKKKPKIMPRSRWTTTKSNAPAARAGSIVGVALHYPGTPGTIGTESESATAEIGRASCSERVKTVDGATGQAEDGIRDRNVTGVQTCALPI